MIIPRTTAPSELELSENKIYSMLALLPGTGDFNIPYIENSICLISRKLQRAGRAFFEIYEKQKVEPAKKPEESSTDTKKPLKSEKKVQDDYFTNTRTNKQKSEAGAAGSTKLQTLSKGPNLYKVLDVPECATKEEIRKAFKRCALVFHPDKKNTKFVDYTPYYPVEERNEIFASLSENQSFIMIQDAYDILSSQVTRKQYDSLLTFDESIPKASSVDPENPLTFFEQFAPVFDRNAKWSSYSRVPSLGTMQSTQAEVRKFYNFWRNFETTRDFSMHDKYDITEAECREERRAMDKENIKIRRKYILDENARVSRLVELAYSLDPRIKQFKLEEVKSKEDKKKKMTQSKLEKSKSVSVSDSTNAADDSIVADFAVFEKLVNKLVEGTDEIPYLSSKSIAELHTQLDSIELQKLRDDITKFVAFSKSEKCQNVSLLNSIIETMKKYIPDKQKYFSRLQNAYSPNTQQNDSSNIYIEKNANIWTQEELKILSKGIQKYPGGTPRRWQLIANMLENKTTDAIIKKSKEIAQGNHLAAPDTNNSEISKKPNKATPSPNNVPEEIKGDDTWTKQQQQELEEALKTYQSMPNSKEKWLKIANKVPGKDAKQCLNRFKQIRNAIMEQAKKSQK